MCSFDSESEDLDAVAIGVTGVKEPSARVFDSCLKKGIIANKKNKKIVKRLEEMSRLVHATYPQAFADPGSLDARFAATQVSGEYGLPFPPDRPRQPHISADAAVPVLNPPLPVPRSRGAGIR